MKKPNEESLRATAMPRAAALAALLAVLALAGCSRGHVGESWQCPLATGGSCGSVAAVDPAVPETAGGTVLEAPLWKPRDNAPDAPEGTACTGNCGHGTGPFGWLGRLLGGEDGEGRDAARDSGLVLEGGTSESVESASDSLASSALPAEPALALHDTDMDGTDSEGPQDGDLRTDEVVARIWIAPFVDGDGVYREASHVRVVLEPASWRTE